MKKIPAILLIIAFSGIVYCLFDMATINPNFLRIKTVSQGQVSESELKAKRDSIKVAKLIKGLSSDIVKADSLVNLMLADNRITRSEMEEIGFPVATAILARTMIGSYYGHNLRDYLEDNMLEKLREIEELSIVYDGLRSYKSVPFPQRAKIIKSYVKEKFNRNIVAIEPSRNK